MVEVKNESRKKFKKGNGKFLNTLFTTLSKQCQEKARHSFLCLCCCGKQDILNSFIMPTALLRQKITMGEAKMPLRQAFKGNSDRRNIL